MGKKTYENMYKTRNPPTCKHKSAVGCRRPRRRHEREERERRLSLIRQYF